MLPSLVVVAVLSLTPASQSEPVHLSARGRGVGILSQAVQGTACPGCRLLRPLALSQNGDATPPPLVPVDPYSQKEVSPPPPPPGGDVPDYNTPPPQDRQQQQGDGSAPKAKLTTDPHLGEWVGTEALVGGLALFGADVVAVGVLTGILLGSIAAVGTGGSSASAGAAFGIVIFFVGLLVHAIVSPLYAALAEKAFADEPTQNGLLGAAVGAYAMAFGSGAVLVVVQLVAFAIIGAGGNTSGASAASGVFSLVFTALAAGARYVGVPIAASYGMHFGSKPLNQNYTEATPHPRWIPRYDPDGRETARVSAPVAFAW